MNSGREAVIPEGLEPLAVWGPHAPGWVDGNVYEKIAWAEAHIDRAADALRAEFYLTPGGPVALVRYFARDAGGRKYQDHASGEPAVEPPVIVPLGALPPGHLLRG